MSMAADDPATDEPRFVIVDMQNIFADPSSAWSAPRFSHAVNGIRRLLPAFDRRVVFTRFAAPERPWGSWVRYYRQWPFALVPAGDPLYEIVPQLPTGDAPVVTRATFGKWGPELEAALGSSTELILAGVSTDCCVLSTALAAADAGMQVRVVADACAGATEADHERALDAMRLYAPLIEITTVDEVLGQG
ncbi:MAG: isochorismatase family cysteine hydrolase [Microbacteriaceae bacterium]